VDGFFCVTKNKRPFDTKKRPFDTKKRPFGRKKRPFGRINGRLRKTLGQTAVSWANGRFLGKTAVSWAKRAFNFGPPTQKLFWIKTAALMSKQVL